MSNDGITRIAVGVGCRKGCSAAVIEALVLRALAHAPVATRQGLFSIADKHDEPGLTEAARRLGLGLVLLTRDALRQTAPFVQTHSSQAERLFGVPSVAECAALAGAGPGSALLVARIANGGATCAIAGSRDDAP